MKSHPGDAGSSIDFPALRRLCEGKYPPEIANNLDIIFRTVLDPVIVASQGKRLARLRRILMSRYLPEYLFMRNAGRTWAARKAEVKFEHTPSPVLVPLCPYRRDHHALLFAVTNVLADRGTRTAVLVSRRSFRPNIDMELFRGATFLFEEDFYSLVVYRRARRRYSMLAASLEVLSSELRLSVQQRYAMKTLYLTYCMQREAFLDVLRLVNPCLVYGLIFVLNPGFLDAIDQMRSEKGMPQKILIQHGYFRSGGFHDFKGADRVLLWGEYFESALKSDFLIPVPESKVVGNPKLEFEIKKRALRQARACQAFELGQHGVLLYASTPDRPGNNYNKRALSLLVKSLQSSRSKWSVIYKPHPGENTATYDSLIRQGLVDKEQIMDRTMSIYELIDRADVVAGTRSTSLIEAMAFGKPVIQLLPAESATDWIRFGVTGVATPEELRHALDMLLNDPDHRETVLDAQRRLVESMHGDFSDSGRAIADYISGLL